ncbi:MAG: hypothetical protein AAB540_04305 [Patescibacteria group bacterium]
MLQQFPLPQDSRPSPEEEAVEMGQITLNLLEKPLTKEGSLNLPQRIILSKLCLATIEDKATPVEQLQEDLSAKGRKASSLANSLKASLRESPTNPKLQMDVTRHPENRRRQGYYLRVIKNESTDPAQAPRTQGKDFLELEQQAAEITRRIQEIQENLSRQIKSPEKDALPIEDPARQTLLATIKDVRRAVEETLAVTSRGFKETNQAILKILLKASEQCEAIRRTAISKKLKKSPRKTGSVLYKLNETLQRSPHTNLALKSQKDPQSRRRFGYYLGLKEETREIQSQPELPASTRELSKEKKRTLVALVGRAAKQTLSRARIEITIFEALKTAAREGSQITPEYCQYIAFQLSKTQYPVRNFEDKLVKMQKIPEAEAELGFRIEKTGSRTWEAVLTKDPKILQPILAEISKEKEEEAKKDPTELKKRVREGLKHLRAQDPKALQRVFSSLTRAYTAKQGLSLEEISTQSKYGNKPLLALWLRKVRTLNKEIPALLGFNVIEDDSERYRLTLTRRYSPAEITFSGRSAPQPIKVAGGTSFDRAEFDRFIADPRNKQRIEASTYAQDILQIFASYAEKGQAISGPFLGRLSGYKGNVFGRFYKFRKLLERIGGRVVLRPYKLSTYYLSTEGADTPAEQSKPAAKPTTKPIQLAKPAKPTANPTQPAEPTKPAAKPTQPAKPAQSAAKPPRSAHPTNKAGAKSSSRIPRTSHAETNPDLNELEFEETEQVRARYDTPTQTETSEEDTYSVSVTTLGEMTNPRPVQKRETEDNNTMGPETPLTKMQREITTWAHWYIDKKTTTKDLKDLEKTVQELDAKKQPQVAKIKQDYIAKINAAIRRADPTTGIIPADIAAQLYSV